MRAGRLQSLAINTVLALAATAADAQQPAAAPPPPPYGAPITLEQAKKVMAGADGAQWGSIEVAREKAYILRLPGASPVEGGLPIVVDGKLIGAVGVSGVLATQGAQIGRAGVEALG